jgi:hypothetical protein
MMPEEFGQIGERCVDRDMCFREFEVWTFLIYWTGKILRVNPGRSAIKDLSALINE